MITKISFPVKSVLCMLLTWFAVTSGHAQEAEDYLPRWRNQIPPSPTSKVYTRYPGYKPDMSTGAMDVSIPLYTATEQDLFIPFTLDYHSNGVRVTDNDFPTGYGWTFNPGLRITRTIMGKADEKDDFDVKIYNYTYEYLLKLHSGDYSKDASYDIYTIHLPNHNSAFLLKKENGAWNVAITDSPLKITPQISIKGLEGFSVVDEKGITYKFGGQYMEKDNETGYPTAWMLYQILLPGSSNQIDITWDKHGATCNSESLYNDYFMIHDYYLESMENPGMQGPGYRTYQGQTEYDYDAHSIFLPKQIRMSSQTIDFTYVATGNRPFLTSMTVKNIQGVEVKECSMSYGYWGTLNSLYLSDEGTYNFEYYGNQYMDIHSQDLWGYYNGKNNRTLVPSFRMWIHSFTSVLYEYRGADRSTDSIAMQNFMLKKITYPTKGYMQIEYEPHHFKERRVWDILINGSYNSYISEGGGVRVKKTISCAENDAPEIVRTYKYGTNENGIGNMVDVPDELRWFVNEQYYYYGDSSFLHLYSLAFRQLLVSGIASNVATFTNNPTVWYPVVTEYEGDNKTVSYFEVITNTSSILRNAGESNEYSSEYLPFYIINYGNLDQRGALLQKKISLRKENTGYVPVEVVEYGYTSYASPECNNVNNTISNRQDACVETWDGYIPISDSKALPGAFRVGNYKIDLRKYRLCKEKRTLYQGGDSIVTEKVIDDRVQDNRMRLPYCTTSTDSRGNTYSDYLYYPWDSEINTLLNSSQRSVVTTLKNENRIATPLVCIRKKGDQELFRKVIQYKNFGEKLLLPEKEFHSWNGGTEEERIVYQKYDGKGNLQGEVLDNTIKTVYLWGYKSQYPVAKIEGATYAEVEGWLTSGTINGLAENLSPETTLNVIRNQLSGKGVMITTYLYKPLIGMISQTAPNGEKTVYHYDNRGRLQQVADHNGYAVEEYDYHYKPQ